MVSNCADMANGFDTTFSFDNVLECGGVFLCETVMLQQYLFPSLRMNRRRQRWTVLSVFRFHDRRCVKCIDRLDTIKLRNETDATRYLKTE
jgi:hypothetical protein